MQKYTILSGLFAVTMLVTFSQPAFAQYDVLEKGLYNEMETAKNKVEIATQDGAKGSGTPYFAADGVLGASLLSGGVFGGIAATLFIRGKKGKYAAIGRG